MDSDSVQENFKRPRAPKSKAKIPQPIKVEPGNETLIKFEVNNCLLCPGTFRDTISLLDHSKRVHQIVAGKNYNLAPVSLCNYCSECSGNSENGMAQFLAHVFRCKENSILCSGKSKGVIFTDPKHASTVERKNLRRRKLRSIEISTSSESENSFVSSPRTSKRLAERNRRILFKPEDSPLTAVRTDTTLPDKGSSNLNVNGIPPDGVIELKKSANPTTLTPIELGTAPPTQAPVLNSGGKSAKRLRPKIRLPKTHTPRPSIQIEGVTIPPPVVILNNPPAPKKIQEKPSTEIKVSKPKLVVEVSPTPAKRRRNAKSLSLGVKVIETPLNPELPSRNKDNNKKKPETKETEAETVAVPEAKPSSSETKPNGRKKGSGGVRKRKRGDNPAPVPVEIDAPSKENQDPINPEFSFAGLAEEKNLFFNESANDTTFDSPTGDKELPILIIKTFSLPQTDDIISETEINNNSSKEESIGTSPSNTLQSVDLNRTYTKTVSNEEVSIPPDRRMASWFYVFDEKETANWLQFNPPPRRLGPNSRQSPDVNPKKSLRQEELAIRKEVGLSRWSKTPSSNGKYVCLKCKASFGFQKHYMYHVCGPLRRPVKGCMSPATPASKRFKLAPGPSWK